MIWPVAILSLLVSQNPGPMAPGGIATPPPCVGPSMTYRWTPTSGCSTSTPCATDQVAGNNASQTSSGNLPGYGATCGPNSTPCLTFNGTSGYITMATPIVSTITAFTVYAIVNATSLATTGGMIGGAIGGLEFRINSSTGVLDMSSVAISDFAIGTTSHSTGTWYTLVGTYSSAGTWTFYHASAGGLVQEDTGSTAFSPFTGTTGDLGATHVTSEYFNGKIAEWGYLNSISTAGIANWSVCHYGI